MSVRAVAGIALLVIAGLGWFGWSTARQNEKYRSENDALYRTFQDVCLRDYDSVEAAARLLLSSPHEPTEVQLNDEPVYSRFIGLHSLVTSVVVIAFKGPSREEPPARCEMLASSEDAAALIARLRTEYSLSEPEKLPFYADWRWESSGTPELKGRPMTIVLQYSLKDKKAGSLVVFSSR